MRGFFLFALFGLTAATTIQNAPQRIVGGSPTTVNQYPSAAAILIASDLSNYIHSCGGTIINNVSILTAASCLIFHTPDQARVRLGSTYANSGGIVHNAQRFIIYPYENYVTEADVALLRTATFITFTNVVSPSNIAGTSYVVPDNALLLTIGWGKNENQKNTGALDGNCPLTGTWTLLIQDATINNSLTTKDLHVKIVKPFVPGEKVEQLQHVQVNAINHALCKSRYPATMPILDTHLCSGILDIGGSNPCDGDAGGPLYHLNAVVGISSYAIGCGDDYYPGVNTKVSSFTNWIINNAV